jgi:hypothetical protein
MTRTWTGIFADILRSNDAHSTFFAWTVRLATIAVVLVGNSSSVSRPATTHTDNFKLPASISGALASLPARSALGGDSVSLMAATLGRSIALPAAAPFHFKGSDSERLQAIDCLAAAGWYEAGNDPNGERSVMQVVLNRVRHPAFPSTVCGVVFQGSQLATGCQFTFTCDGSLVRRRPSGRELAQARRLATEALDGDVDAIVGQATHYHANYVSPWWSTQMKQLATVGLHIFYRWPEQRGYLSTKANVGPEADYQALAARAEANYLERKVAAPPPTPDLATLAARTPAPLGQTKMEAAQPIAAPTSTMFMAVDPSSAGGAWAVAALRDCAGRRDCQVLAYGSTGTVDRNRAQSAQKRDRPLFLFIRDGGSSMEVALWDCSRIKRPTANECRPGGEQALAQLMRERG